MWLALAASHIFVRRDLGRVDPFPTRITAVNLSRSLVFFSLFRADASTRPRRETGRTQEQR
jgi:hypothetical protein